VPRMTADTCVSRSKITAGSEAQLGLR
jgi:hypothetical protein